ncbi:hypothetical protein [Thiolapillus sp.]
MKNTTFFGTLCVIPACLLASSAFAQGVLENPRDNSFQSGIGIFSGWYCDAEKIELIIDDRPAKTAAYGTPRGDTKSVCGDTDNGFGLLFFFNMFGTGIHTVRALADGVEFDRATFSVDYLDPGYMRGLTSWVDISVPELGKKATLLWQESIQAYTVSNVRDLDYSLDDVFAATLGKWSGTWQSAQSAGGSFNMNMEKVQIPGRGETLQPTQITITNTGCSEKSRQSTPITSLDDLSSNVDMKDGSKVDIRFLPTETLSTITGVFVFNSGPCKGLDGAFTVLK